MSFYVELSATAAWLFGETSSSQVGEILDKAGALVSSELTLIECDRAIYRAVAHRSLSEAKAADLRNDLTILSKGWHVLRLLPAVMARARQSFPDEPIRTLDALHIASALEARSAFPELIMLSLDLRVRKVAASLGFALAPE